MSETKVQKPVLVDEEQFTAVVKRLLALPPKPKASIPRKRATVKTSKPLRGA